MSEDSEDDKCNCSECYTPPSHAFRIKEGTKEPFNAAKTELPGIKRGFLNAKKTNNDAAVQKPTSENATALSDPNSTHKEAAPAKKKPVFVTTPDPIECEKTVYTEKLLDEEKIILKCTNCSENNDVIEIDSMGAFRVICTGGCILTLHRNCFEKTLGSGKKRELKATATCPNIECHCKVDEINHRVPGKYSDFALWLRCEVPESERPKKEEKGKEMKKKDKTKLKKEREEQDVVKVEVEDTCSSPTTFVPVTSVPNCETEGSPFISLALPIKAKEDEAKKSLVKPLPADLEARPMERKEDAVMSKYAVKETTTKEIKKKTKKEVQKVILPGLTVKGQRGRKDEDDQWVANETSPHMEDIEQSSTPGAVNTDFRYDEGPYGFAMPEEIYPHTMGEEEWNGNGADLPFRHPLPMAHPSVFRPVYMNEDPYANYSSQPLHEMNGPLSGFTESPSVEEPPLIENPFDYPNLESESVRKRKELVNFFATHTPVLEENASLFDGPQIDLDTLKCMLEQFIELEFSGHEDVKESMTDTLLSIFAGEVESDIIPFLIDLDCFKYGYVDGRLVVSTKTDRREREDQIRRNEEEDMRIRMEEQRRKEMEEEDERRFKAIEEQEKALKMMEMKKRMAEEARQIEEDAREQRRIEEVEKRSHEGGDREPSKHIEVIRPEKEDKKIKEKELEKKTREAINALRNYNQTKSSSSDSSPERKEILTRTRATESSSSFNPPTSSTTFYSNLKAELNPNAPPFIPSLPTTEVDYVDENSLSSSLHRSTNQKAELNPNAPAFIPTQPESLILMDENGAAVDEMWIEEHEQLRRDDMNMIEELRQRIAQLEEEKKQLEDIKRLGEIELSKHVGTKINEDKKNQEIINRLQSENKDKEHQLLMKDKIISQKNESSAKQSEEMNQLRRGHEDQVQGMMSRIREANLFAKKERIEKENTIASMERAEEQKRKSLLERKTKCAKEAIVMCTYIINRLATDCEAQVMTSIFIELRNKWVDHHSILNYSLLSYNCGDAIDWEMVLSLKEPSMPRETDELVQECYVSRYQSMHIYSHRLASSVKKCLRKYGRNYDDVDIIGIIQKWMLILRDPSKIDATVPQVANMVAQAMGDVPLVPPKYVHVSPPTPPSLPLLPPRLPPSAAPSMYERMVSSNMRGDSSVSMEPKGWKKLSDKVREVPLEGHECCICLDHVEGGDISYCEKVSCNEPYHNDCLDRYWKTGFRNCPRCRTPMPPRDAFPALG